MPRLYDDNYPGGFIEVDHINAYLLPGPDIYVTPRATPFYRVPPMIYGSKPTDGGYLLLKPDERDELIKKIHSLKNGFVLFSGRKNLLTERNATVFG